MTTQAAPKTERNKGPIAVSFVDNAGKDDYKRVPKGVTGVVITAQKDGSKKTYSLSGISPEVKDQMVLYALATRMKQNVNNHVNDDESNVLSLTDTIYTDLLAGKMYSKAAEGKGPGKKFDASIYVEAMAMSFAEKAKKGVVGKNGQKIQPMTDEKKEGFKLKLESFSPAERKEYIQKLMAAPLFKKCYKLVESKRISLKSTDDGLDDLL